MNKKLFLKMIVVILFAGPVMAEVKTVASLDLNRYVGKWFEVASIPQKFQEKCTRNTTAEYSFAENGFIKVLNSCDTSSGTRLVAEGRAMVVDKGSNSKLKVTFVKNADWLFKIAGDYWVIDLASDYSYSVVGDPYAKYAWILSRTPNLPPATLISAAAKLEREGYNTCEILTSVQTGGFESRIPLCNL